MAQLATHDALVYLMVITSASDRDMTDVELERIGSVVRSWPVFEDFDSDRLVDVARACQKMLHGDGGLASVLDTVRAAIPEKLHDTAYAMAFEVASADMEMRMEERRVLQLLRRDLAVDAGTVAGIERATKARHRTLT